MLSGLSGNELYCLDRIGWRPGNLVVGNSVWSLGIVRGITSGLQTLAGGEIRSITEIISEGRHAALARLRKEAINDNAGGVTGVTSELRSLGGYIEFLAVGSSIRRDDPDGRFFSTACSGQDLYCQVDSGYEPMQFVIGNVAYALGIGRGLMGLVRTFAGGEVREFSEMYNHTRHLALERLEKEAQDAGSNSVVDINTSIHTFGPGVREMLMVGTASHNDVLGKVARPVTSELTGDELWNLTNMGYAPLRLVLGTSIYALGFAGGIGALFRSLVRGELDSVTRLIYEARENCLEHLRREADAIGADATIGIKMHIYELGAGLVEVMAIGTAVKKLEGIRTKSPTLMAQAVTRDRDMFVDNTFGHESRRLERV